MEVNYHNGLSTPLLNTVFLQCLIFTSYLFFFYEKHSVLKLRQYPESVHRCKCCFLLCTYILLGLPPHPVLLSWGPALNLGAPKKNLLRHSQARCLPNTAFGGSALAFKLCRLVAVSELSPQVSCPWGHAQLTSLKHDTLKHSCKNRALYNDFFFTNKHNVLSILVN